MEYILQEIFARLTIYNFCERIITTIAIQQKNRKYTYQTNFTVAVFICREYFRDRIHPSDLVALIRKNILPIREGRKAPRKVRPNSSKQLLMNITVRHGSSAIIRYYCYIPCTSTLLQATACHIFHTLYVLSFLICY